MFEEENQIINEESAQAEAVRNLITVKKDKKNGKTDVESKTDLTDDDVRIHSVLHTLNDTLDMALPSSDKCILGRLIDRKEIKLWSKDRKSREEIVAISRQPDMNQIDMIEGQQKRGLLKRLFTPRK